MARECMERHCRACHQHERAWQPPGTPCGGGRSAHGMAWRGMAAHGTAGGGWQRHETTWKGLQVACSGVAGWWHASARQAEQQKTDGQGLSWHEQYASGRVKVHQPIGGACNSSTMPRCRAHQMLQMQAAGSSKEAAPAHLCFFHHTALQRTRIAAPVSPRHRIQQRRLGFRNAACVVGACQCSLV